MQQTVEKPAVRAGWNEQEETLLWAQVTQIRRAGLPLRSAFENMARLTGRKPNSIRNYYYARVKEGAFVPEKTRSAFVPFTKEETQAMLETVLSGQARGRSVRGITLEMGGGDKRAMLRYQNKYRSVLKNTPQEVYAALERLRAEGKPAFDPYAQPRVNKAGRKPGGTSKTELDRAILRLKTELRDVSGVDTAGLIDRLASLAARVGKRE